MIPDSGLGADRRAAVALNGRCVLVRQIGGGTDLSRHFQSACVIDNEIVVDVMPQPATGIAKGFRAVPWGWAAVRGQSP